MNFYKILDKIFILVLIIFIICCSKMAVADEKPIPVSPVEIKSLPAAQPETGPPTIMTPSNKPNRNAIGCVLPLSGQYAAWGHKASDAILLSAKIFNRENKTSLEVIVEDSGGLPEKTKAAIAHLANDKNVMAIIAVTETAEAAEAAREAQNWKVPLILITSKEGVTSAGEYVFQHFLIPTQQIRALVHYTFDDLNCAIFSILYPQDNYGEEMVKIFSREVINIGGKVEKAIPYSREQTDFADEISKLTGRVVRSSSKTKADKNDDQGPASVDFEALFIPDSYLRVKMITSQLNFYDVKGFQLLGTSLWHSPELLKNGAEYLEDAVFTDSFFVNGFYPETINFVDTYYAAYSREPENIEALSFDTAGIIFSILENKNVKTRQDLVAGLIKMENYNGATGNIYFDSNRVAQKTAFILKVKDKKLEQVR
ncbi:MAG: penicillin-binding protein activator [Smithella sp.]|jgi:ABC-type branched-subunit amino acid transport system substrate-binding protein